MVTETSGNPTFLMLDDDSFCFCLSFSDPVIGCEGATDELHLLTTTWGGADYLYWEFKILDLDTDDVLTEFTNLDFGDTDDFTILCNRFNIPDSPLIFTFDEPTAATIIKNVSTSNRKFKLIGIKLVEDDVDFGIEIYPVGGTPTYTWITENPPNYSELHTCLAPNV